jgi:hypothetical protein
LAAGYIALVIASTHSTAQAAATASAAAAAVSASAANGSAVAAAVSAVTSSGYATAANGSAVAANGSAVAAAASAVTAAAAAAASDVPLNAKTYGFYAFLTAATTINAGATNKVPIETTDYNHDTAFSAVNNRFVCSQAGTYRFYGKVVGTTPGVEALLYHTRGVTTNTISRGFDSVGAPVPGNNEASAVDTTMVLLVGDIVELYGFNTTGGNINLAVADRTRTFLSGYMVSRAP